jgi:hypothetical protein
MSHDGYYASSRDDAPPPAPHSATSGFNEPANPTTVHSMADANGLLPRTHVVLPPQLQDDEDQAMSDSDRSNSSAALNLAQASVMDIVKEGKRVIAAFLRETQCYDVVKNSGKVVVFDVKIPINLAFFALVEHGKNRLARMVRARDTDALAAARYQVGADLGRRAGQVRRHVYGDRLRQHPAPLLHPRVAHE